MINMVNLKAKNKVALDNSNTGRKARNMRIKKQGPSSRVKLETTKITRHCLRSLICSFSKNKGTQYLPQK